MMHRLSLLYTLLLPFCTHSKHHPTPKTILLDVDNTLYSDESLPPPKVERQIIENTFRFCKAYADLSPEECDELYRKYGTTVQGLGYLQGGDGLIEEFYRQVYKNIDLQPLLSFSSEEEDSNTGFTLRGREDLRTLLKECHKRIDVYLVSNSPRYHIHRVLSALGLSGIVPDHRIRTPDVVDPVEVKITKSSNPKEFYRGVEVGDTVLLDDSTSNLKSAEEVGIKGEHIRKDYGIGDALLRFLIPDHPENFEFDSIQYLSEKNKVDEVSMNRRVWDRMISELEIILEKEDEVRIVDLGCGLLHLFQRFLEGNFLRKNIVYVAYESEVELIGQCRSILTELGLSIQKETDEEMVYYGLLNNMEVTVHLCNSEFQNFIGKEGTPPHLIVGSCFADLFPNPRRLLAEILALSQYFQHNHDMLLYFPITYAGATITDPPSSSDARVFKAYNAALEKRGHNLNPATLIRAAREYGGVLLDRGPSSWHIRCKEHGYLWNVMLYFVKSCIVDIMQSLDDAHIGGWFQRCFEEKPDIIASNVDLLFRFRSIPNKLQGAEEIVEEKTVEKIQFVSPHCVQKVVEPLQTKLGKRQIEIESVCSLISTGTELKIFQGNFDSASQLDVNIKSMSDATMAYPLSYGYSLVGKIVDCGRDIPRSFIGRHVFSFSPHASRLVAEFDDAFLVPKGIHPLDAIFFPSVETALSIVHDLHPRLGERVAIFGQGLIGLLVTSILSRCSTDITAFDMQTDRLALSSVLGATHVLKPGKAHEVPKFDVAVEVSGNPAALQSAIDGTASGGRVIIASWYGDSDLRLKLGIAFHRSHKTLKTSQVSTIPSDLTELWSKKRRFDLTWDLVRKLRPSERLLTRVLRLEDAQLAYELLERGEEIAIAFDYS